LSPREIAFHPLFFISSFLFQGMTGQLNSPFYYYTDALCSQPFFSINKVKDKRYKKTSEEVGSDVLVPFMGLMMRVLKSMGKENRKNLDRTQRSKAC
jgi:hypothetical protein